MKTFEYISIYLTPVLVYIVIIGYIGIEIVNQDLKVNYNKYNNQQVERTYKA